MPALQIRYGIYLAAEAFGQIVLSQPATNPSLRDTAPNVAFKICFHDRNTAPEFGKDILKGLSILKKEAPTHFHMIFDKSNPHYRELPGISVLIGGMLINNGLQLIKDLLAATKATPKTAVFIHANDTFGMAQRQGMDRVFPNAQMPFQLLESIAYDPKAQDLSVEVTRIRARSMGELCTSLPA